MKEDLVSDTNIWNQEGYQGTLHIQIYTGIQTECLYRPHTNQQNPTKNLSVSIENFNSVTCLHFLMQW